MNNPESDQNYSIQYTDEDQLLDTTGSNGVKVEVIDSVGDPYTSYEHSGKFKNVLLCRCQMLYLLKEHLCYAQVSPDTSACKRQGSFALTFCKNLGHQGNFQKFQRASRQS